MTIRRIVDVNRIGSLRGFECYGDVSPSEALLTGCVMLVSWPRSPQEPIKCEWKRGGQFHTTSNDSKMPNP